MATVKLKIRINQGYPIFKQTQMGMQQPKKRKRTKTTPTCLARLKPTTSTSPFFTWMCASQQNITQKPQKATTENLPCTSETRKISKHVSSLLSLRFGGQVFVCSWTLVSALVPTLFLINATNQSIQPQGQPQPPLPALQDSSQPLQQAHSSLGCVPVNRTSHKSHRKQPQKTCHALQKPEKYPSTSQVFCHSDLEGKCLCAHGRLSQLWCQHFSSSMRQINPYSRKGNHNHPYLPCKTQANHFNKPTWMCASQQNQKPQKATTENLPCTSETRKISKHVSSLLSLRFGGQVFVVLMDACLSSGANTFPHQCDKSIQQQPQPPLPALQDSSQPLQQAHSSLGCVPVNRTSHKSHRKQPQKTCHALQKPEKYPSTSQVFCHKQVFVCSWTLVSASLLSHQCDRSITAARATTTTPTCLVCQPLQQDSSLGCVPVNRTSHKSHRKQPQNTFHALQK